MTQLSGNIRKMVTTLEAGRASYSLPVGDEMLPMDGLLGQSLQLRFAGQINCVACGRLTKKSYNQGYCFPCVKSLAECDICIVRPEKCHYDAGTCRQPEWGEAHCLQPHVVYLSNTSGLKVGITRRAQVPTRWIDQGATQALPIFAVSSRLQSGLLETLFKNHMADRTDWRAMLKGAAEPMDLAARRDALLAECAAEVAELQQRFGEGAITPLTGEAVVAIAYPVDTYPEKIKAHNLDKTPEVSGILQGIKGQYLILDSGVINMRKYAGYHLEVAVG